MIQFAWLWLRYQPGSELAEWFRERRRHVGRAHAADRHCGHGAQAVDRALALLKRQGWYPLAPRSGWRQQSPHRQTGIGDRRELLGPVPTPSSWSIGLAGIY